VNLLVFNLATDADDPILGFTTDWLNALARYCEVIHVITMRKGRLAVAENVHVHSVGKEKGYSELRRAWVFYRLLLRILRENKIDAAFAHMMPLFAVLASPLLIIHEVPVTLWYVHRSTPLLLRFAEVVSDSIVSSSEASFPLESEKLTVVGHGIDTDFFSLKENDGFSSSFEIISVSRISPIKNIHTLIHAANLFQNSRGEHAFEIKIIGAELERDQLYADSLRKQIEGFGLTEKVRFTGSLSSIDLRRQYQEANLLVNLTASGSFDKVVLEAMSCGVLVLTSNTAFRAVLEPIEPLLFVPKNDPYAIADHMHRIMALSPEARTEIGRRLRDLVVAEHDLDRLANLLVNEVFVSKHVQDGEEGGS